MHASFAGIIFKKDPIAELTADFYKVVIHCKEGCYAHSRKKQQEKYADRANDIRRNGQDKFYEEPKNGKYALFHRVIITGTPSFVTRVNSRYQKGDVVFVGGAVEEHLWVTKDDRIMLDRVFMNPTIDFVPRVKEDKVPTASTEDTGSTNFGEEDSEDGFPF